MGYSAIQQKKFKSKHAYSFPKEARKAQKYMNDLIRLINKDPLKELYVTIEGEEFELTETIRLKVIDYSEGCDDE